MSAQTGNDPETVGVVGTGSVGEALTRGFSAAGYEMVVGSRSRDDPDDALATLIEETGARLASPADAARAADAVVLAVPGSAVVTVADSIATVLGETPVLDPTNGQVPDEYGSLGEAVAAALPEAPVAKAFNTIGANRMTDPEFADGPASMFVCGDERAVGVADTLARALGFDVVVAGDISAARHLEAVARAWVHLAGQHGRDIGFRLLGVEDGR